jgi:hypothetical protein
MKIYNRPVSTQNNHIIFNSQYFQIVLNDYKTKKNFGTFRSPRVERIQPLYLIIEGYMHIRAKLVGDDDNKIFLIDDQKKPINKAQLAKLLTQTIQEQTGKRIGVTRLRRIYESELIQSPEYSRMTLAEKRREHERLLHSFETAQQYNIVDI